MKERLPNLHRNSSAVSRSITDFDSTIGRVDVCLGPRSRLSCGRVLPIDRCWLAIYGKGLRACEIFAPSGGWRAFLQQKLHDLPWLFLRIVRKEDTTAVVNGGVDWFLGLPLGRIWGCRAVAGSRPEAAGEGAQLWRIRCVLN
jgi:hypothetical protein